MDLLMFGCCCDAFDKKATGISKCTHANQNRSDDRRRLDICGHCSRQAGRLRTSQSTKHSPACPDSGENNCDRSSIERALTNQKAHQPETRAHMRFREPGPKTSSLLRWSDYHDLRNL